MVGILGQKPTRQFKVYQTKYPAIFRFNGKLYVEEVDQWVEIKEKDAEHILQVNGE